MHPGGKQREPYVASQLKNTERRVGGCFRLREGTAGVDRAVDATAADCAAYDGYGRSESRASLRDFFEVDAKHIVLAALTGLLREGKMKAAEVKKAIADLGSGPRVRIRSPCDCRRK